MSTSYQFQFSSNGEKDLKFLDKKLQHRIVKKLEFFEKSGEPLSFAKQLQGIGNRFCFRVGDYRIIVSKKDRGVLVVLLVLKIGHRREVYNQ